MAGCKIEAGLSPQFNQLREYYRKHKFPHVDDDLSDAFKAISENVQAKNCRPVARMADVLDGFRLHKYRQNSQDIKRGADYGWRIYALYDPETGMLYPVLLFPKTAMQDCDGESLKKAIKEVTSILKSQK